MGNYRCHWAVADTATSSLFTSLERMKLRMTLKMAGRILVATSMLALAGVAQAAAISVFDTGVDGSGTPLPDGTVGDPHYTLLTVPAGTTDIRVRTSAGSFPIPPWNGDDALSAWIGPNNNANVDGPVGQYDFHTTFDLTGWDPTIVFLTGQWSTDNQGLDILLNGVSTGNTNVGFPTWSAFMINSGFVAGVNTLDFIVNNTGGPAGVRVEVTAGNTPEPASFLLIGAGLAALGMFRRKFAKSMAQ